MPELRTPVHHVWVEYICDECGSVTQAMNVVVQGKTLHHCVNPKCRRHYMLDRVYPFTEESPDANPESA